MNDLLTFEPEPGLPCASVAILMYSGKKFTSNCCMIFCFFVLIFGRWRLFMHAAWNLFHLNIISILAVVKNVAF